MASAPHEQQVIDLDAAVRRRDAGMAASLDHAERTLDGWADYAYGLLLWFSDGHSDPWTVEAFRAWAAAQGLPPPPDLRAFGGVTQRALRRGVITKVGYAPAASSNGSPKPLYLRSAWTA